jgi:hypothetical protein
LHCVLRSVDDLPLGRWVMVLCGVLAVDTLRFLSWITDDDQKGKK